MMKKEKIDHLDMVIMDIESRKNSFIRKAVLDYELPKCRTDHPDCPWISDGICPELRRLIKDTIQDIAKETATEN